jgi:hypothetical protein
VHELLGGQNQDTSMKRFAVLFFSALAIAPASADDLCSAPADVSARLMADKSATKLETIRNQSGYITDRLKQLEIVGNCSEAPATVSFSCSLNNYLVRTDPKRKPSPGFLETDAALRKCYSPAKNEDHKPALFQKTYSWGNGRFDLVLFQIDEALILNVIEIVANPREFKPESETSSGSNTEK